MVEKPVRGTTNSFSLMAYPVFFLIGPGTASPGMESQTKDWAFPHQLLVKEMNYTGFPSGQSSRGILIESCSSSNDATLCQVDVKLTSATSMFMNTHMYFSHALVFRPNQPELDNQKVHPEED